MNSTEKVRGGLTVRGLSKSFSGQKALSDVSMTFPAGEITALLGHNGSGKSTLIKVLAGFHQPDEECEVNVNGRSFSLPVTSRTAHAAGLRFMHQDLALVEQLTIADNFAFADRFRTKGELGPISRGKERRRVASALALVDLDENPDRLVGDLDSTSKTVVAMARALQDSRTESDDTSHHVLFLDEPTAALPRGEVERVLQVMRTIRDRGGAVVLVSHRIDEVMQVADRVVVLRDGRVQTDRELGTLDADALVDLIVGKAKIEDGSRAGERGEKIVLNASSIAGNRLEGVDLDIREGEILGVAGLVGCGRSELCRVLAGAQLPRSATVRLDGEDFAPRSPGDALAQGVSYVPQDRRGAGLVAGMSLQENFTMGNLRRFFTKGWLNLRRERRATLKAIAEYDIRPTDPKRLLGVFSGGNQQKAVVARAVSRSPKLLVMDEPMQGIDIGARREIAQIIRRLADDGMAVVVASSDAADMVGLCDRVVVLNRGRIVAVAEGNDITEEELTLVATNAADRDQA